MTSLEIAVTTFSVQSAKPGQRYGQLATLPVLNNASEVFLRAPLTKIPAGATVSSAVLRFYGLTAESGSRTLHVQPTSSQVDSNIKWTGRPGSTGTQSDLTKSSPQIGTAWDFVVTTAVQQVVSGQRVDFGWRLRGDAATANLLRLAGSSAAKRKPVLLVTYSTVPDAPENLHPSGGAVSVAKPSLTFDAHNAILALQVQVDPAQNATTPAFDSGTVAASGGLFDLAASTYAGLASGATTYWRARQQTAGGWSAWSAWVAMTRTVKPALTLTNPPTGTVDDGTPPVQWTFAGTQVAWQARLLADSGDVIADSGYTPGTDTDWTPRKGLTRNGQQGTVEVLVWDDQDRAATPTDPEYARVTCDITLAHDATVTAMSSLGAAQDGETPDVELSGSRASIPDEVVIFRDGTEVARLAGTDVFTGQAFTWTDQTPPMTRPVKYRVAPRVNGKIAAGGPEVTVIPYARGIWLQSLDTGDRVMLYVESLGTVPEQTQPEASVVHTPLNTVEGFGQVVRRRLIRYRPQGTVKATLMDPPAYLPEVPDCATAEALMRGWADDGDAGDLYWLTFSGFTGQVIIGNVEFAERDNPQQETRRMIDVTFDYWGQA